MKVFNGSKRGFELQFNWLFVLIAGAVLLGFLFLVIRNQIGAAEEESATASQSDLGFILKTSQGSRSSEKLIPLPGRFIFSCDGAVSTFMSAGSSFAEQYNYLAVFSPKILDSRELIVKTETFKAPFSAMPFIYLSNRETLFVLTADSLQLRSAFASLPEDVGKKTLLSGFSSLSDDNFDLVILLADASSASSVAGSSFPNFVPARQASLKLLVVEPQGGVAFNYGRVKFYEFAGSGFSLVGESYYFTQEQLLGAVYSADYYLYSCQFQKSVARLGLVSLLQKERAEGFFAKYSIVPACKDFYASMIADFSLLSSLSGQGGGGTFAYSDAARSFEAVSRLGRVNSMILETTSCPPVY